MAKRRQPREERPKVKLNFSQQKSEFLFILSFYEKHRTKAILVLILMMASNSLSLAFPGVIGRLLDSIQEKAVTDHVWQIVGFLMGLFAVQAVTNYFTSVSMATITENVLAKLRTKLFHHILHLPMSFFGEKRVGELMSRVSSDVTQIQETFTFTVMQMLRQGIFLVGGVTFIVIRSVRLTMPVLLTLPILIVIAIVFGRRLRKLSTKIQDVLAGATTIVEETFQAIESVKSYTNENYEYERYGSRISEYVVLAVKGARLRSIFFSFIMFAVFGGIAGVLSYGVFLVHNNELKFGDLVSFILYSFFVASALGTFAELFGQIQRTLGASVRVREILSEKPENTEASAHVRTLRNIRVDSVLFRYPGRPDIPALDHVSMTIREGERVAFVGESGAGKSTTAALLQKFYEPDEGTIYYDNIPSFELSLHDVRSNIGIVPQDIVLFGSTIEDNIRYGNVDATAEQVWDAARLANAADFIRQFPEKMQTLVGERGVKLSGGQRQRIAIARAILKNPPILILDEATSSLDSQSEYLIQEALENLMKGRTTIIIAHRLSTIRRCDTIFVFSQGKVIEQGSHDQLLSKSDSLYARLCELQFGKELRSPASAVPMSEALS